MPTASDVPSLRLVHQVSPSPLNPLGVKGLGQGGAIAPPVAIAPYGAEFNATPVRPEQVGRAVAGA
jgi:carbon-monoxide dehydrogenase large subunit